MPFSWSSAARKFKDAVGRFVSWLGVRGTPESPVDIAADATARDLRAAGERLIARSRDDEDDGNPLGDWQREMERILRAGAAAAGQVGAGGAAQFGDRERRAVEDRLRFHLDYLDAFADELEQGLPLDAGFLARSELYAGATIQASEAARRAGDLEVYGEERRWLNSAVPCGDCESYAAQGWQPAGTLPGIGESCACRSNCRCTFDRRLRIDDE